MATWTPARYQNLLLLLAALLLTVAFGPNLARYLHDILSSLDLLRFESTLANDVVFTSSGLLLCAALVVKRFRLSRSSTLAVLLGLALYVIARCSTEERHFTHFYATSFFVYADTVIPLFLVLLLSKLSEQKNKAPIAIKQQTAVEDDPIDNPADDEFGFDSTVQDVASFIRRNKPRTTRTIGVHGTWGAGKTSFINLIRASLKKDKVRFIDFTPWQSSEDPFSTQLLSQLVEAIDPKEQELREELGHYSEVLGDISIVGKFLRPNQTARAKRLRESINARLTSSGYTYVVVVDDIDRLTSSEMLEVLKLIRSSVDFNGLYYLLAYDRIEVNRGLKHEGIENPLYLDKFVELEIGLPHVSPTKLGDFLVKYIDLGVDAELRKNLKTELYGSTSEHLDCAAFVSTPRDAKRLALSTNVFYHRVEKDITLYDAVLVQMLRMRYPELLGIFVREFRRFLEHEKTHSIRQPYVLKREGNRLAIELALDEEVKADRLGQSDMNNFMRIVRRLFPERQWSGGKNYNSARFPESFYRYFTYYLESSTVSEADYAHVINGSEPVEAVAERILAKDQALSLCVRMEHGSNRAKRWRVIEILFALARAERPSGKQWHIGIADSTHWLRAQLTRHNFQADDEISPAEQTRFISELEKGIYPYDFERTLLNSLYGDTSGDAFIIGRAEIKQHILRYIDRIIDHNPKWNKDVGDALADCSVDEWRPTGPGTSTQYQTYLKEGVPSFEKVRVKYGTKPYCMWFLQKNQHFDDPVRYGIHTAAAVLYGGWDAFREHLVEIGEADQYVAELLTLYDKLSTVNFQGTVDFTPVHLIE